jgi:hypothetical protein
MVWLTVSLTQSEPAQQPFPFPAQLALFGAHKPSPAVAATPVAAAFSQRAIRVRGATAVRTPRCIMVPPTAGKLGGLDAKGQ